MAGSGLVLVFVILARLNEVSISDTDLSALQHGSCIRNDRLADNFSFHSLVVGKIYVFFFFFFPLC